MLLEQPFVSDPDRALEQVKEGRVVAGQLVLKKT